MNQIVILCDDLSSRSREVESVRLLSASEVVKLEDQVLWQKLLVSPYDPTYTGVDQTELVTGDID